MKLLLKTEKLATNSTTCFFRESRKIQILSMNRFPSKLLWKILNVSTASIKYNALQLLEK